MGSFHLFLGKIGEYDNHLYKMDIAQGLSGQPLSGPDIGGYAGNATPKMFGRWMGVGAMFPFCRGHSETGTIDHEPWSFGQEVCPIDFYDINKLYIFVHECIEAYWSAEISSS